MMCSNTRTSGGIRRLDAHTSHALGQPFPSPHGGYFFGVSGMRYMRYRCAVSLKWVRESCFLGGCTINSMMLQLLLSAAVFLVLGFHRNTSHVLHGRKIDSQLQSHPKSFLPKEKTGLRSLQKPSSWL